MYCNKCGAVVVGKFCSCCGVRVRSQLEEYRLAERHTKKAFEEACCRSGPIPQLELLHLASACWYAAYIRYSKARQLRIGDSVPAETFEALKEIRAHAEFLFNQLYNTQSVR